MIFHSFLQELHWDALILSIVPDGYKVRDNFLEEIKGAEADFEEAKKKYQWTGPWRRTIMNKHMNHKRIHLMIGGCIEGVIHLRSWFIGVNYNHTGGISINQAVQ